MAIYYLSEVRAELEEMADKVRKVTYFCYPNGRTAKPYHRAEVNYVLQAAIKHLEEIKAPPIKKEKY